MKKRPILGNCAICGCYRELTFEHIPPRAAFNNKPTKAYLMDDILKNIKETKTIPRKLDGIHYKDRQKGYGDYLLCAKCNNMTGHLYAPAYINFNNSILKLIADRYDDYMSATGLVLSGKIQPLNFTKQVLSMFCCSYPDIKKKYPIIPELVLNRDMCIKTKDCPFRLLMFLLTPDSMPGSTGPFCAIMKNGQLDPKYEIDFPPFGFQIYESNIGNNAIDITNFLSFRYDETAKLDAQIPIYRRSTILPVSTLKTP